MTQARFSCLAEADLNEIFTYIARDKPRAAANFVKKIRDTCRLLAANPEMGQRSRALGSGERRFFSVGTYLILYRRTSEGIEVARVVSGYRNLESLL